MLKFRLDRYINTLATSAPEKENLALPVQFSPPHLGKGQIPTPGKALQIKFPTSRAQKMVKCPGFARGGGGAGDVEVSI